MDGVVFGWLILKDTDALHPTPHQSRSAPASPQGEAFDLRLHKIKGRRDVDVVLTRDAVGN